MTTITHEPTTAQPQTEMGEELAMLEALPEGDAACPDRLPATAIEELGLFKVRATISGFHVDSLAKALESDGDLTPLLVLYRDGKAFLIDGHHRKAAYEAAGRDASIPVQAFPGTVQEAILEGQRVNRMHTLAMSTGERMNCAWKLVKLDMGEAARFTTVQIMAASAASRAQVGNMRRVLRELGSDAFKHDQWWKAMKAHQGKAVQELTEDDHEMILDQDARRIADAMVRTMGTRPADNPELLARAIEFYSGRRCVAVIRVLYERNSDQFEFEPDDDTPF